jgi:alpha-glucosidase
MKNHRQILSPVALLVLGLLALWGQLVQAADKNSLLLTSPDGQLQLEVSLDKVVSYTLNRADQPLLLPSRLSLEVAQVKNLLDKPRLAKVSHRRVDESITPTLPTKSQVIRDHFNEMTIELAQPVSIIFRAYDNGIAYRFVTRIPGQIQVNDELVEYNFSKGDSAWLPVEESFYSHNERSYIQKPLAQFKRDTLSSLPALVATASAKVLITESDLQDYPGLWLKGTGKNALAGTFARFPTKVEMEPNSDRNEPVKARAKYLAITKGERAFPWRILAVAKNDAELLTNQLVYQLAEPSRIADTSWIKPGKVAWDWYNTNNLFGVDFKAGVNTQTYKHYIDFAAEYGLEYVILDEGWYNLGDLLSTAPNMNIEELVAYGKQKNVKIVLWVIWKTLDLQFDAAFDRFEKLGVAGIKVDFMQRDDQGMVNYYWKITEEAAKRKLLINLHGAYKPAGLQRTFPNAITREGVKGLEWNKWSYESTPEHNVTLPFIRMVAGAMDYTPGAMSNGIGPAAFKNVKFDGKAPDHQDFSIRFTRPMSQTTRVHQMAMFSVFESPMQMMADTPSNYRKAAECAAFIAKVPAVWDETRVLHAAIGDYLVVARRKGSDWFIGAMGDEFPHELAVDLSFLPAGTFAMESFADGINADFWAEDYQRSEDQVGRSDSFTIKLAPAGGWTARLTPAK